MLDVARRCDEPYADRPHALAGTDKAAVWTGCGGMGALDHAVTFLDLCWFIWRGGTAKAVP